MSGGIPLHISQKELKAKKERKGLVSDNGVNRQKGNKGNQGGKRDVGLMSMQGLLG